MRGVVHYYHLKKIHTKESGHNTILSINYYVRTRFMLVCCPRRKGKNIFAYLLCFDNLVFFNFFSYNIYNGS